MLRVGGDWPGTLVTSPQPPPRPPKRRSLSADSSLFGNPIWPSKGIWDLPAYLKARPRFVVGNTAGHAQFLAYGDACSSRTQLEAFSTVVGQGSAEPEPRV